MMASVHDPRRRTWTQFAPSKHCGDLEIAVSMRHCGGDIIVLL